MSTPLGIGEFTSPSTVGGREEQQPKSLVLENVW